jgi:UDP-glucuronate decarboxylase
MKSLLYETDIEETAASLGDIALEFEGKTILLTGGTGFLGQYFMATFAYLNTHKFKSKCRVISADNLITSKALQNEKSLKEAGVEFIKYDVIQPYATEEKIDFIIHGAGIASPYYYRAFPLQTLDVAVNGTRNMLELAKKNHAKILFFSSSEIYGDPDSKHVPTTESYKGNVSCLGPRACYDESKRLGETLCRIYHTQFGVETKIARPFNVFGPGMKEKDYRVLPNFASRIVSGDPLWIYGNGKQTRTFCYITDALNGFLRVLVKGIPGEPYNIGNPTPEISVLGLAEDISKILRRDIKVDLVEYPDSYPADEPQRRCPDIQKARVHLEYNPKVEFFDGLTRYLSWAQENYTGELNDGKSNQVESLRGKSLGQAIFTNSLQ